MKRFFSTYILIIACVSAWAVPARRDGQVRTAADGTQKEVFQHGNEFFHYMTDAEGNWLDEETLLPMSEEAKTERTQSGERAIRRATKAGVSRLLAPRGPVILVSYADQAFSNSQPDMYEWAMGENYTYDGATGSINRYFNDVSGSRFNLWIDVYGPVTVSKNAAYYGQNSGNSDLHPDELVMEACQLAVAQGADFSQYDSNNDGEVDWVVILYAGKGEADGGAANTIWPHQADLHDTGKSLQLQGKKIDHYCCLNEIDGQTGGRCGIGTFCHEFGHIMGLPDVYATIQSATHKTCGRWDVMDYGCYNNDTKTPAAYTAYERWWMGWMEPQLINQAASVSLPALYDTFDAAYITDTGAGIDNILYPNPTVFYMLENRQQHGWDAYIPGHGLVITKINYHSNWWSGNTVNNSSSNMGIDIIEADGLTPSYKQSDRENGYFGKQGDTYPSGATSFTRVSNYPITNIAETNGLITFDVNGGGAPMVLDLEEREKTKVESRKIVRDGRILIIRGNKTYDILGNENHQL